MSTSITGSPLQTSYSPYELENPLLSPANPFELRPLLWFNRQLSENINLRVSLFDLCCLCFFQIFYSSMVIEFLHCTIVQISLVNSFVNYFLDLMMHDSILFKHLKSISDILLIFEHSFFWH